MLGENEKKEEKANYLFGEKSQWLLLWEKHRSHIKSRNVMDKPVQVF